jgi:putative N6-adenine-specific DNA methylase
MNVSYDLFLIIPPGLEDLAKKEVELKCPVSEMTSIKGGLSLKADIEWIIQAHALLKIPTRILMRMAEFKVRDFPKLYQKMLNFKWTPFLSHPQPEWEITCTRSRLMHTGRIEETLNKSIHEALKRQPLNQDWEKKKYSPQCFYVRICDDVLTLSLDLTGVPLYKRGYQVIKGEAPLRENFAAAFVFEMMLNESQEITLVDPMCGSGTFLTEALTFFMPLHLRKFSFEEAPFFKGRTFKIIPNDEKLPIKRLLGFDINDELINRVKKALAPSSPIQLNCRDSLKDKLTEEEVFIICNPPYGERIKIQGKRGHYLSEAWKKFIEIDRPLKFGWLLPSDMDDLFHHPKGYELLSKRQLRNGGMAVTFWIWKRSHLETI